MGGDDRTSMGDGLGVVGGRYGSVAAPHVEKPAYAAARVLLQHLRGALYRGRVSAGFAKPPAAAAGQWPGGWKQQLGVLAARGGVAGQGSQVPMADPDGVSVMGYADLPQASVGSPLYVLEFAAHSSGNVNASAVYAVWSIAGPSSVVFAAAEGCYRAVDMFGVTRPGPVCTQGGMVRVDNTTDAPLIIVHTHDIV